jgi:predicted permease
VTRRSSLDALRHDRRTSSASGRTGKVLVAVQVSMSLVLVTNAGLLLRSLQQIFAVDSGFQTRDVSVTYPRPPIGGYTPGDNDSYYPQVIERIKALPGVERASISLSKPAGGFSSQTTPVAPIAEADLLAHGIGAIRSQVAPGFFDVFGIPVIGGRDFSWRDTSKSRRVAIVSQSLARALFGDTPALGRRLRVGVWSEDQDLEVIGVVADARLYDLTSSNLFAAYTPALQAQVPDAKCFVIKGRNVPLIELKRRVEALGRDEVGPTETVSYITGRTLLRERMTAALAGFFGALALLLAGIGLYGLMTYTVTERRREIGIRMALGAEPLRVMSGVVRDGLTVTLGGAVLGLAAALGTVQLVKSQLFGITPHDPVTLLAAPSSLIVITILACLLPAARAARVDPMLALRAE